MQRIPDYANPDLLKPNPERDALKQWLYKLLNNHPQRAGITAVLDSKEQEKAISQLAENLLNFKKTDAGKFNQLQKDPTKMNFLLLTTCLNEKSTLKMSGKDLINLALTPEHQLTQSPEFRKLKVGIANEVKQLEDEDKKADKATKDSTPAPELSVGLNIIRLLLSPFKLKPTPDQKKTKKEDKLEEEEELKPNVLERLLMEVLMVIMSMLLQAKIPGQKSLTNGLSSEDQVLINTFGINIKDGTREATVQEVQAPGTSTSTFDEIASGFTEPLEDILTGTRIEEQEPDIVPVGKHKHQEKTTDAAPTEAEPDDTSEAVDDVSPISSMSPFKKKPTLPGSGS